ncbi:Pentatricopeptide repeat-containing protein [Ananas comosus]|uniref:Pentatricopeptide repeat-containing protein n=1 Tax=Ananas comosus TaxID=4615 RepID=A0A199W112_ANACO|nr:Pentatricopeptide repeat-containing protein [Ananas comosus]
MSNLIPPSSPLVLLPHRLSASERDSNSAPNFRLDHLVHPVLARLERCASMAELRALHAHMTTTGLARDSFAASRLLAFSALSLQGDLRYALDLFRRLLPAPNLFAYNAMVRAFSRSNRPDLSLRFYVEMLQFGLAPDSYTFPFLLKSCAHLLALSEGLQVHAHVVKMGFSGDPFVGNSLIHFYAEIGRFELAELLFDQMPERERNEVSWASMISGFVSNDRPQEALALFCSKDWRNMDADQITLVSVLSACAQLRELKLGKDIHCYIEEKGVEVGLILGNSLMNMYAKSGQMEIARELFENMATLDSISWNILISGFVENGSLEKGLEMFSEMNRRNVKVNEATFLSLVSACGELELGLEIHHHVRNMGFDTNISICNALIDMYSRIGSVELASKVFDEMTLKDIISWNSMISCYARSGSMEDARILFDQMLVKDNFSWSTMVLGYVRNNEPEEAIGIYKELMKETNIEPDNVTVLSFVTACAHLGALEEGKAIHSYIKNKEIQIDISLGTALIDMYSNCGCLGEAAEVFHSMREKDVSAWTALISGLAMHGRGKEAIQIFKAMQTTEGDSPKPNSVTFLSVLSACAHAGLVQEGWEVYNSMLNRKLTPEMAHVGCMVDLLGRAGHLKEAFNFIKSLNCEVEANVWGALLSACRTYGDVERGEIAYAKIVELDPLHDGAHVLMSNIYAKAGCWNESKAVRRRMKDEGIRKEVGRSWIEVDGALHVFTAGIEL